MRGVVHFVAAVALFVLLAGLVVGCVRVPSAQVCVGYQTAGLGRGAGPDPAVQPASASASACVDLAAR